MEAGQWSVGGIGVDKFHVLYRRTFAGEVVFGAIIAFPEAVEVAVPVQMSPVILTFNNGAALAALGAMKEDRPSESLEDGQGAVETLRLRAAALARLILRSVHNIQV